MEELESIVHEMEEGNLSLEDALKKFENGLSLSRFLSKTLDDMEKKVTVLLEEKNGNISESPFEPEM